MITWESYFERVINLKVEFHVAVAAISGWAQILTATVHIRRTTSAGKHIRPLFATQGWGGRIKEDQESIGLSGFSGQGKFRHGFLP
jgi:hypothetical protein